MAALQGQGLGVHWAAGEGGREPPRSLGSWRGRERAASFIGQLAREGESRLVHWAAGEGGREPPARAEGCAGEGRRGEGGRSGGARAAVG
jgi:hypothetical protein